MMKNFKSICAVISLVFTLSVAAAAQDLVFTSLDGQKVDLAAQKGKVVVLAVGVTWLPLSRNQAVAINKLAKRYEGREIVFYFVATDSMSSRSKNYKTDQEIGEFATTNKLPAASILRDSDGLLSVKQFKLTELPAFIILDKEGRTVDGPITGIDPNGDISIVLSQKINKVL